MLIRQNKIKLICGFVAILNMMSCSEKKFSDTAGSILNSKPISAKAFLKMNTEDQQNIINQNQSSCAVPMLFAINDENNLGQYNRDSVSCIKICRLNYTPPTASNGLTYTETTQLVIDVENIQKYVEQNDADGINDVIGDCQVEPPCYQIPPVETQSLDVGRPINPIAPLEYPNYCNPPSESETLPSPGTSSPPSLIGPPVSVEN